MNFSFFSIKNTIFDFWGEVLINKKDSWKDTHEKNFF